MKSNLGTFGISCQSESTSCRKQINLRRIAQPDNVRTKRPNFRKRKETEDHLCELHRNYIILSLKISVK